MIHVGIDLHFDNMFNVAVNNNGNKISEGRFAADENGLQDWFSRFDEPVQAVVECTGFWYWVADWCQANEIPLLLAHSKMTKAISYAKVKTDQVDAYILAELLRTDFIPQAHMQMGPQRDLRELTRGRLRMVQRRERLQTNLWNLAAKYHINIHDFETGWRYPDRLWKWLKPQLPEVLRMEAHMLLDQAIQIQEHIGELEAAIEGQGEFTADLERLLPVPGFGLVTAWSVLAEVGDITRFPTDKKFLSYSRVVPGSKNSSKTRRHKSACKDGNKYLRLAFGQAAVHACRHYGPVKRFYNKIRKRSGKKVARAVVAKELAKISWHILSKQEDYKGFKGQPTRVASRPYWPQPISLHPRLEP